MIQFVTGRPKAYNAKLLKGEGIELAYLGAFSKWLDDQTTLQYDIETTMVKDGPKAYIEREIITLQFGNENEEIFVLEAHTLDKDILKKTLQKAFKHTIIAHNARFEYIMSKLHLGLIIEDIHDTMLMSKVLNSGLDFDGEYHSLGSCAYRWLKVEMDKTLQTSFTHNILSAGQIIYAATDVAPMHAMMHKMKKALEKWELWNLYNETERHFLKVMGDMETDPMRFDEKYWRELGTEFADLTDKHRHILNRHMLNDPFLYQYLLLNAPRDINHTMIYGMDTFTIKWAGKHKTTIFDRYIPEVKGLSRKPELVKWYKANKDTCTNTVGLELLKRYLARDFENLNSILLELDRKWLIDNQMFLPQGHLDLNWNSQPQKLYIFRYFAPQLMATDEKTLAKVTNVPLINEYKKYAKVSKFNSTYGTGFIDKNTIDGKYFAPRGGQQILATGRLSFGIALTMPSKDERAVKLRNGFLPPHPDWRILATDYASAELVIMAKLANESRIIDGVKNGLDIHSMSASLMFPDEWEKIAEPGCEHLKSGKKCECKQHNKFRSFSKSISFGCAYGISAVGLSETLGVTQAEAQELINRFFKAFPSLEALFVSNGEIGKDNLWIRGPKPAGRVRFYHKPITNADYGDIERQSKNFPKLYGEVKYREFREKPEAVNPEPRLVEMQVRCND